MDLDEAAGNFERATKHCDNLIEIHRNHGGGRKGRRDKETTLNRAVIMLTVAAWQAVVQDLALACMDVSDPGPKDPNAGMFRLLAGRVRKEVGDFATPNAQNTRALLVAAGLDPRSVWTWSKPGGAGRKGEILGPHQIEETIDSWLKIRHAIAHGHAELPPRNVLEAVRRAHPQPVVKPSLRLTDAEQCLAFFRRLTASTGKELARGLGVECPPVWARWRW